MGGAGQRARVWVCGRGAGMPSWLAGEADLPGGCSSGVGGGVRACTKASCCHCGRHGLNAVYGPGCTVPVLLGACGPIIPVRWSPRAGDCCRHHQGAESKAAVPCAGEALRAVGQLHPPRGARGSSRSRAGCQHGSGSTLHGRAMGWARLLASPPVPGAHRLPQQATIPPVVALPQSAPHPPPCRWSCGVWRWC